MQIDAKKLFPGGLNRTARKAEFDPRNLSAALKGRRDLPVSACKRLAPVTGESPAALFAAASAMGIAAKSGEVGPGETLRRIGRVMRTLEGQFTSEEVGDSQLLQTALEALKQIALQALDAGGEVPTAEKSAENRPTRDAFGRRVAEGSGIERDAFGRRL